MVVLLTKNTNSSLWLCQIYRKKPWKINSKSPFINSTLWLCQTSGGFYSPNMVGLMGLIPSGKRQNSELENGP